MSEETPNFTAEDRERAIRHILRQQKSKEKRKEYHQLYDLKHKKENVERHRLNYLEHQRENIKRAREHHLTHKEEDAKSTHQYQVDHKKWRANHDRQYRLENKEAVDERCRRYHEKHPEVTLQADERRRALELGADGFFTYEEFKDKCVACDSRCVYCGQELPLVPDHATPLSRGGSNDLSNIVPSCSHCNFRKGTLTYNEFVEKLKKEENILKENV
jgi:hypothetical protein